ncbi:MAG: hypothetical protein RLZZ127_1339, partial [Planctomycetota bacterium]
GPWRLTAEGAWQPAIGAFPDGPADLDRIIPDPAEPTRIAWAVRENAWGVGIFRTNDGGATWGYGGELVDAVRTRHGASMIFGRAIAPVAGPDHDVYLPGDGLRLVMGGEDTWMPTDETAQAVSDGPEDDLTVLARPGGGIRILRQGRWQDAGLADARIRRLAQVPGTVYALADGFLGHAAVSVSATAAQ